MAIRAILSLVASRSFILTIDAHEAWIALKKKDTARHALWPLNLQKSFLFSVLRAAFGKKSEDDEKK